MKYYTVAKEGNRFTANQDGRPCIIVRTLYGLVPIGAGASFRAYLTKHLRQLGYQPCKADPGGHMRKEVRKDGTKYWAIFIAYVDDILCCGMEPQRKLESIEKRFKLKDGTIEELSLYLGADIGKHRLPDGTRRSRWLLPSIQRQLWSWSVGQNNLDSNIPKGVKTPITADYMPEIDATEELNADDQNYYQGLIGILRWICELGRLDIVMPVSLMSQHLAQARRCHFNQVLHLFVYLKHHGRSKLVFDAKVPKVSEGQFTMCDLKEFYPGAKEVIPPDAPEALGKGVTMGCFVDVDFAGCKTTRRSHTGVIIFLNNAPIIWFLKRQAMVETLTFGSEIVAMRIAVELVKGLCYKLQTMGVAIDGNTNIYCDNKSVVNNVTRSESPCKKKHNIEKGHCGKDHQGSQGARWFEYSCLDDKVDGWKGVHRSLQAMYAVE